MSHHHHHSHQTSTVETAYCHIHGKRRIRIDLLDDPEAPGRLRCHPRKECRQRPDGTYGNDRGHRDHHHNANRGEAVVCRIHGKRRNVHQMKEVTPGVYECTPSHQCRIPTQHPGGAGGGGGHGGGGGQPFTPYGFNERSGGLSYAPPPGAPPPPPPPPPSQQQTQAGGPDQQHQQQHGGNSAYYTHRSEQQSLYSNQQQQQGGGVVAEVWCVKHGKRMLRSLCEAVVEDIYYVCRDAAGCTSTPAENATSLQRKNCKELMCMTHRAMRNVKYVQSDQHTMEYHCLPDHPCRGTTIPAHLLAQQQQYE